MVSTGDTGLSICCCLFFFHFPTEQSYSHTLSGSDVEEQHDRRSVCESTFR